MLHTETMHILNRVRRLVEDSTEPLTVVNICNQTGLDGPTVNDCLTFWIYAGTITTDYDPDQKNLVYTETEC